MIHPEDLCIVHYCHPSCSPFQNICRLPREGAFRLAREMTAANPEATAFGRFADFENYYPRRMAQDEYLYAMFTSLGGKPKERHPLSFVLHGSDFLDRWFGRGSVTKIKLMSVPPASVSFTLGDSMSAFRRDGKLTMYTKEMLLADLGRYEGSLEEYMADVAEKYGYIEAQLWDDDSIQG